MGFFFLSPPAVIAITGIFVGASIAYHFAKNMNQERMQIEALVTSLKDLITEERKLNQENMDHEKKEIATRLESKGTSSGFKIFDLNDDDDNDLYTKSSSSQSESKSFVHHVRKFSNSKNETDSETSDLEENVPTDYSEVISDINDYEEVEYISRP